LGAIQTFYFYPILIALQAAKERQELSIDASRVQTNYKAQYVNQMI
jgi:hypothetical protein